MDPGIRLPLISLYTALVLPLPWLAPPSLRTLLLLAVAVGFLIVVALTSETVELDAEGIRVGHPRWCRWLLRRGWSLPWSRVKGLKPGATSQGGRVFYVKAEAEGAESGAEAWLLPLRVAEFDHFLDRFSILSGLSTEGVGRPSPAWTYRLLGLISALMIMAEMAALLFVGTHA